MRGLPLALLLATAPATALAGQPQILALVATPVPVEMRCDGAGCRAELTTFCLQESRVAPRPGTRYDLGRRAPVTLMARLADGRVRQLPAEGRVAIRSLRSFSAVEVRLPAAPRGALALAIAVGADAALVPAGEPDAEALRQAMGPLRAVGRRVIETPTHLATLGATNALINAISTEDGPSSAEAIWARAVADRFTGADARGLALARAAFDDCTTTMSRANGEAARVCLRLRHDAMVDSLTHGYWAEVRAGS